MIKTEEIKRLLDRYYDGMTTEEEEKALHTYFNGSDIDASLTEERIFFTALQSSECPTQRRLICLIARRLVTSKVFHWLICRLSRSSIPAGVGHSDD